MNQTNKEIAVSFLRLITEGKIREAFEKYISTDFRHHNGFSKGDAESLMVAMEENEARFPGKVLTVHHALADGDFVAVHSHLVLTVGELELSIVHIMRFSPDHRIAELWDVAQPIKKDSLNQNGAF